MRRVYKINKSGHVVIIFRCNIFCQKPKNKLFKNQINYFGQVLFERNKNTI